MKYSEFTDKLKDVVGKGNIQGVLDLQLGKLKKDTRLGDVYLWGGLNTTGIAAVFLPEDLKLLAIIPALVAGYGAGKRMEADRFGSALFKGGKGGDGCFLE